MNSEPNQSRRALRETGIKVLAGAGGGLMGAIIAGPAGAVVGSVAGNAIVPLFEHLGLQFHGMLGEREKRRITHVFETAARKVRENREAGLPLRGDGFLSLELPDHSAADEVCEAVIRRAQTEYEERKVTYQGYLLGNLPFNPDIDRAQANLLVRLAFQLSYRQLCLLALYADIENFDVKFKFMTSEPASSYSGTGDDDPVRVARREEKEYAQTLLSGAHFSVRQESYDLYAMNLIRQKHDGGPGSLILPSQFMYDECRVVEMGRVLHDTMELRRIDRSELERLASLMRDDPTFRW